jgi:hypothetical protein
LTQIAEQVSELDRRYAGGQNVLFDSDPLLPSTPGAQHEQERSWNRNVKFKGTGCVQPHDNPLFIEKRLSLPQLQSVIGEPFIMKQIYLTSFYELFFKKSYLLLIFNLSIADCGSHKICVSSG